MLPEQAQQAVSTYASALATDSDETLAAKGDTESFVALYRAYLTPVYRYAYARTGNKQEAEDATSATFERAWRNLPSYRPTGSFRGWLFTIAHRTLVDQLRRGYGRETVPVESVASTLPSSAPGPEEWAVLGDRLRGVLQSLARLGSEQHEIVVLRFFAELTYDEIAAVMGKSEAAVKMAAYRALEAIRQQNIDL